MPSRLSTALAAAVLLAACEPGSSPQVPVGQEGCALVSCHGKVEQIHYGGAALSCVDCHGGNPTALTKELAHPTVSVSFNPSSPGASQPGGRLLTHASIQELDEVDPKIIKFLNPSDYRVVAGTCGSPTRGAGNCHTRFADQSSLSAHATLSGQLAGGLYFGGLTDKAGRFAVRPVMDPYPPGWAGLLASLERFPATSTSLTPLVLLMKLLKPGGRAGLVLPDGTLFGEGVKTRIKERLLSEFNLHTIVRLPNGVFNPYTGIRTNLLFFDAGKPTSEIWYYEHPYPPGAKSYNKGKPIRIEEFEPERAWWDNRVENEQAWRVSIDQIKAGNYNLDLKNPHNPDTGPGDVDHLLPEYEKLLAQIAETRAKLKQELHHALSATAGTGE